MLCSRVANHHASRVLKVFLCCANFLSNQGSSFQWSAFSHFDVYDDLREHFQICGQFVDTLAASSDQVKNHEGRKQAIGCRSQVREEDVARLLAAQGSVVLLHLLKNIAITNWRTQ